MEVGTLSVIGWYGLGSSPECLEMMDTFGEDLYTDLKHRAVVVVMERTRGWVHFSSVS
jgi:hypothetical protein